MMRLPPFTLLRPRTVDAALEHLDREGAGLKVLAGGTDLLPAMKQRLFTPPVLMALGGIDALRTIAVDAAGLYVGATVTLARLEGHSEVRGRWPALAEAASGVGTPLVRATATLGGNLLLDTRCLYYNQSAHWRAALGGCLKKDGAVCHVAPGGGACVAAFAGDLAGVLLVYGAEVEIVGPAGRRRAPVAELYPGRDGARGPRLGAGELLVGVWVPRGRWEVASAKFRPREAIDFGSAVVAVGVRRGDDGGVEEARVVLSSVDPRPLRVGEAERILVGGPLDTERIEAAAEAAYRAARPLDTHGVPAGHRKRLVRVGVRRTLLRILGLPPGDSLLGAGLDPF